MIRAKHCIFAIATTLIGCIAFAQVQCSEIFNGNLAPVVVLGIQADFPGLQASNGYLAPEVVVLDIQADFPGLQASVDDYDIVTQVYQGNLSLDDPRFLFSATVRDLSNPDKILSGIVRPRGNTSLAEMVFPKLRLEIESTDVEGTFFEISPKWRINPHVILKPDATASHRIAGVESPWREGLVYEIARTLGVKTLETQLAQITYRKAGVRGITRNALLIETDGSMRKRYNSTIVESYEFEDIEKPNISGYEGALYFLFQRMVGNDDVYVRVHELPMMRTEHWNPFKNVVVLKQPDGTLGLVASDFDVATSVTGFRNATQNWINRNFDLNRGDTGMLMTKLAGLRARFSQKELIDALETIESKKAELYRTVRSAHVDEEGQRIMRRHLDIFFQHARRILTLPIVIGKGYRFYTDSNRSADKMREDAITGDYGTIRPGTPIKVLGQENGMLKVAIIDMGFDLKFDQDGIGYVERDLLIGPELPIELVGLFDSRDLSPH